MESIFTRLLALVLFASLGTGLLYSCKSKSPEEAQVAEKNISPTSRNNNGGGTNFVSAAKLVTPGVVHIKTMYEGRSQASPFERRFGGGSGPAMGSGSGVIIGSDGYIATNNHVVENASQIEIILPDRRWFAAKMVGRDPNTDLALLKVDAKDLPVVELGNSDDVEIGEWVLAVGYPFSLNTTVTAGIISAKGRSIGIINRTAPAPSSGDELRGNTAIESFIQTDAAINPGNSGGALVDMNGKLIGINTAIASLTGSYAGYAFAIPVNLAQKILGDLKEFGKVKRGILGVSFPAPSVEENYFKQQGINPGSVKGVFITGIQEGSAAADAGLKEGDIIQTIDDVKLYSASEFSERIARHRPGDKIELEYLRNGKSQSTSVTLKGEESRKPSAATRSLQDIYDKLGAQFSTISPKFKERYDLSGGVVVTDVAVGGFFYQVGILPGTIIVLMNNTVVNSPEDVSKALLEADSGRVQVLGIAPDGSRIAFNFSLGT